MNAVATVTRISSIQGEQQPDTTLRNAICRGFRHDFDGNVLREKIKGKIRWVFHGECRCGTLRLDVMQPRTWKLLWRDYDHPKNYDGSLKPNDAKKMVFKYMLAKGVTLSSIIADAD